MEAWHKLKRCPIHVHITTLAILLVLLLGGSLGLYNYHQTKQLINSAAGDYLEQLRENIELEFQRSYNPVAQTVKLLLKTDLVSAEDLSERLQSLPVLVAALENRPELTALEAGYANGDFFIVRVMADQHMRDMFNAPPNALFAVDNIDFSREPRQIQRLYFDARLIPLGPSDYLPTEYDPRKRGWFTLAKEAVTAPADGLENRGAETSIGKLTEPYLYFFIRKVGVTFTQYDIQHGTVVAGDIALDMLAKSVQTQNVSPNSHLLILDKHQQVLAYNRSTDLISSATDNKVRLKTLTDLQHPLLNQVSRITDGRNRQFEMQFNGETWQGQLQRLTPIPEAEFQLLLLTPESDLLAEAYRIRKESGFITLLMLLVALPLTLLMTRRLSVPLERLIGHCRKMKRFRFDNDFPVTGIAEVDDLHQLMDEMQHSYEDFFALLKRITAHPDALSRARYTCSEVQRIVECDGVMLYLAQKTRNLSLMAGHFPGMQIDDYLEASIPLQLDSLISRAFHGGEAMEGPLSAEDPLVIGGLKAHFLAEMCMLAIPLKDNRGKAVGVMVLLAPMDVQSCQEKQAFCEALAGFLGAILLPDHNWKSWLKPPEVTSG